MMPGLRQWDEDDYHARGGEAGWRADRALEQEYRDRRCEKQDSFEDRQPRRWNVWFGPLYSCVEAYDSDEAIDAFVELYTRNGHVFGTEFDRGWEWKWERVGIDAEPEGEAA